MTPVIWITASLMLARCVAEWGLAALNRTEVRRHRRQAPPAAMAIMDGATYAKAVDYTLAKSRLGSWSELYDAAVLAAAVFSGFLPWLFANIARWGAADAAWLGAVFIMVAALILALPGLPFEWWNQFRVEARFGFNHSTPKLWVSDKLKGAALLMLLGFPLLWLLLSLVRWTGVWWWLWGFALLFLFQLLMLVLYPKLILPLFNKLTPLPAGELHERLMALGERTGFRARTIQVMDGSKRSAHSNAFFTGFGRFRRIVLFDTLVQQLEMAELEAVLAHEIGHYRRKHVPKMLAVAAGMQLAGLAAIAWLARSPWFNEAFGFAPGLLAPSLLLFLLLSGLVTFWVGPLGNYFSRRHEYEADAFARDATGGPGAMVGALRKLARKNLSNLTPHPWFSAFYYSHPTLVERERALAEPTS